MDEHTENGDDASATVPLLPSSQKKFVNKMPNPLRDRLRPIGKLDGLPHYEVGVWEVVQDLGIRDPDTGKPLLTRVWGYGASEKTAHTPGPTIFARSGEPIRVTWRNELRRDGIPLPSLLPVDTSIHWANPPGWPLSGVPLVTHLHGGRTESASDGYPEAWFTPGFALTGPDFVKRDYLYSNNQEMATLLVHDHTLGTTRLNVYAGLSAFYIIRESRRRQRRCTCTSREKSKAAKPALPGGEYDVGIMIQDRQFTKDGQLFYPDRSAVPGAPFPSVLPNFFGEFILTNGKLWPYFEVEPRKYRLRLLNNSDTRFYALELSNRQEFFVIASDQGLLDAPVATRTVKLGSNERFEVVVDFARVPCGGRVRLLNVPEPTFPGESNPPFPGLPTENTREIVEFRVVLPLSRVPDPPLPRRLRRVPIDRALPPIARTRSLLLDITADRYGRTEPILGTAELGRLQWMDPVTETPSLDTHEVWEFFNVMLGLHPMHVHLVRFLIISQQRFTATQDPQTGALSNIVLGDQLPIAPEDRGWKDVVRSPGGVVTRIVALFPLPGRFVWHCHILSHEDHDMMRPYEVISPPTT